MVVVVVVMEVGSRQPEEVEKPEQPEKPEEPEAKPVSRAARTTGGVVDTGDRLQPKGAPISISVKSVLIGLLLLSTVVVATSPANVVCPLYVAATG